MVGSVEQSDDFFLCRGCPQRADETIVAQRTRHVLQGAQMIAGSILRRNEQDEHMNRLSVEAIEGDTLGREGHGADESLDTVVLGMGDGNAPTDAGRAEKLA